MIHPGTNVEVSVAGVEGLIGVSGSQDRVMESGTYLGVRTLDHVDGDLDGNTLEHLNRVLT